MSEFRYTEDHEWVRFDDDGLAVVGITDHAQDQLGEIVFIELPKVGDAVDRGAEAAVIESVKAASEVFAPLAGTVAEVNERLDATPGLVNEDPVGEGWFLKIETDDTETFESLMTEDEYRAFVESAD